MAHWQNQSRSILGLAALLTLLLAQTASSLLSHQSRIDLTPRTLYRDFGSIVGMVLTGTRHIADDLELLYELHQLATGPPRSERPVPVSRSSAPSSSTPETICEHRAIAA